MRMALGRPAGRWWTMRGRVDDEGRGENGKVRISAGAAACIPRPLGHAGSRSLIGAPNRTPAQVFCDFLPSLVTWHLATWNLRLAHKGVFRIRPLVGSCRCLSRMKVGLVNPPSKK